jgi:hypothetical protein
MWLTGRNRDRVLSTAVFWTVPRCGAICILARETPIDPSAAFQIDLSSHVTDA